MVEDYEAPEICRENLLRYTLMGYARQLYILLIEQINNWRDIISDFDT